MGLTLIEAAKYENRLEHLAVLMTFSEGESPPPGCRESAKGVVAGQPVHISKYFSNGKLPDHPTRFHKNWSKKRDHIRGN